MASGIYNQFKAEIMKKTIDLVNDTVKVILLNNSHTFDADTDGYANVSANELTTTGGYTAGGATLGSKTVTADDTNDKGVFDGADVAWTTATFSAYHAVIYDDTPTSPADPLIASIDFGGVKTVASGTFTIQWHANGILSIA